MKLQESGENYLETIYLLNEKNGFVRSIDVANELNFSKPSISRAMRILKEAGFILIERNGQIRLTEAGYHRAKAIYERHCLIKDFLIKTLQISDDLSDKDACRIEHVISDETFEQMKRLFQKE